jgi:hypothetical protein
MFSVPKTKNIKNLLIVLLLLPTISNCSLFNLTDNTIVHANLPMVAGGFIVGTGISTAFNLKIMSENDNANKIVLGISLASLAGGYAAYKCLNYFTPLSKFNKAKEILQENEKLMNDDSDIYNLDSVGEILSSTHIKYPEEDFSEIAFFKKNLKPLLLKTKQANTLIRSILTAEVSEKKSFIEDVMNVIYPEDMKSKILLLEFLKTEKANGDTILKKLAATSFALKSVENFKEHLNLYNTIEDNKEKSPLRQEKLKYLQGQNSYINNLLYSLLSNATCMNSLVQIIIYLLNSITG